MGKNRGKIVYSDYESSSDEEEERCIPPELIEQNNFDANVNEFEYIKKSLDPEFEWFRYSDYLNLLEIPYYIEKKSIITPRRLYQLKILLDSDDIILLANANSVLNNYIINSSSYIIAPPIIR